MGKFILTAITLVSILNFPFPHSISHIQEYANVVISEVDKKKADPFDLISITGSGFTSVEDMLVAFSKGNAYEVKVPPLDVTSSNLVVPVPFYFDSSSGKTGKGKVDIWAEIISQKTTSNTKKLTIKALPTSKERAGVHTEQLLVDLEKLGQYAQDQLSIIQKATSGAVKTATARKKLNKLQKRLTKFYKDVSSVGKGEKSSFTVAKTSKGAIKIDEDALALSDQLVLAHLNQLKGVVESDHISEFGYEFSKKEVPSLMDIYFAIASYAAEESVYGESGEEFRSKLSQFQKKAGGATYISKAVFDALEHSEEVSGINSGSVAYLEGGTVAEFLSSYAENVITHVSNHYICASSEITVCVREDVVLNYLEEVLGTEITKSLLKKWKTITGMGEVIGNEIWKLGKKLFSDDCRPLISGGLTVPNIAGKWTGKTMFGDDDEGTRIDATLMQSGSVVSGSFWPEGESALRATGWVFPRGYGDYNVIIQVTDIKYFVEHGEDDVPCYCYVYFYGNTSADGMQINGFYKGNCWPWPECPNPNNAFDLARTN